MSGTDARRFVDGTVGYGGHTEALLRLFPEARVLGMDRDEDALTATHRRLERFEGRVFLVHDAYAEMEQAAAALEWDCVDGVLLDVGISSPQIDTAARGFSHRQDGPLDMRMDRRHRTTAATLLNTSTEEELVHIFRTYGEERRARQVAKAVVRRRADKPWARTGEFADLVTDIVGRGGQHGLPAATRCFQALRIAVNDELGQLEKGLAAALRLLKPGGRLAVISFHSLEDRLVKHFMRHEALSCVCPPDFPVCRCDKVATLSVLTRKPVRPGEDEIAENRRAASAKLRVAEKLGPSEHRPK
jgi:16S rRNA (cytosine1402-N4)-methyltransferase